MSETAVAPTWVVCAILETARDFPFTKAFLTRLKNRAASLGVDVEFDFNSVDPLGGPVGKQFVFRCQEIASDELRDVNPEHVKAANDLSDTLTRHIHRNCRRCPSLTPLT